MEVEVKAALGAMFFGLFQMILPLASLAAIIITAPLKGNFRLAGKSPFIRLLPGSEKMPAELLSMIEPKNPDRCLMGETFVAKVECR